MEEGRIRRRGFVNFVGGTAAWSLCCGTAGAQPTSPALSEPTPAERLAMAKRVAAFMQQYTVPGFSVAIGRSGRLLYQEAFG